jgi:transglutaminase-like putative cysteine protease
MGSGKTAPHMRIRIQHRTTYRYAEQVTFSPHRVRLRPREGHDVKIEDSRLIISPAHRIQWLRDVHGNSLAVVHFLEPASELTFASDLTLQHFESNPFDFYLEPEAVRYPFLYDAETFLAVSSLAQPAYPEDDPRLRAWLGQFFQPGQTVGTLEMLQRMNAAISQQLRYATRYEEGVQSPGQTLASGTGTCRDYATLFIEACRCLGLAARFVSGYILGGTAPGSDGSTHAWAEVYLPGGGWKGFDPTLATLTTSQHVSVALARVPEDATPISGSYLGPASAFLGMDTTVRVEDIGANLVSETATAVTALA